MAPISATRFHGFTVYQRERSNLCKSRNYSIPARTASSQMSPDFVSSNRVIRSSGRLGDEHDREASWHGPRHQPPQTRQSITTTPLFKSSPHDSHCGAFEVAYQLGLEGRQVWGEPAPHSPNTSREDTSPRRHLRTRQ